MKLQALGSYEGLELKRNVGTSRGYLETSLSRGHEDSKKSE